MYKEVINRYAMPQNVIELNQLFKYVDQIAPKVVVQVGIQNGDFLRAIKELFHPDLIIGIDSHPIENVDDDITHFIGDPQSGEVLRLLTDKLGDKRIDFLFLNHDKTATGIKKEYGFYEKLVRPGGIIAFEGIRQNSNAYRLSGIDICGFWSGLITSPKVHYYEFWDVGVRGYGPGIGMIYKLHEK